MCDILLARTPPQNPKPLTYRFAEIFSAEFDAPRVIAERVEVFEDALNAPAFEHRRVFGKHVFRPNFPDDAGHFAPEAASFAADSDGFRIRRGNVLAREAAADDVDLSAPRFAVESPHVVPNWELRQDSVALPLEQNFAAVGLDFDGADACMPAKHSAEYASAILPQGAKSKVSAT